MPFSGIETFVTRSGDAVADTLGHILGMGPDGIVGGPHLGGHAARDERRPAGTAQRIGTVGAREAYAIGGQGIHRRGLHPRIPGARHGAGRLLIGHDDDEVRPPLGSTLGSRSGSGIGQCECRGRERRKAGDASREVFRIGHNSVFGMVRVRYAATGKPGLRQEQNYAFPSAPHTGFVAEKAASVEKDFVFVQSDPKFVPKTAPKRISAPEFYKFDIGLHKTETPLQNIRQSFTVFYRHPRRVVVSLYNLKQPRTT